MKHLAGKVAVITGAASGIGRALAIQLTVKHQAKVWAADINSDALDSLCEDAAKYGGMIEPIIADVSQYHMLKSARDQILQQEENFDIWINNAGVAGLGGFAELPIANFDHVININLRGVANGTHLALESMQAAGVGTIVNVASVAGHVPAPYMAAYVASKHAVVGFTRSVRRELKFADSPITMILVSPGFVKTQMIQEHAALKFPDWLQWSLSTPESVAKAIIKGIRTGKEEVTPTLNGQFMRRLHQVFPDTAERGSKLILASSLKDALLNRYDR